MSRVEVGLKTKFKFEGSKKVLTTVSSGTGEFTSDIKYDESRALEGRHVRSKSPSRVRDGGERVPERNGREKDFPN